MWQPLYAAYIFPISVLLGLLVPLSLPWLPPLSIVYVGSGVTFVVASTFQPDSPRQRALVYFTMAMLWSLLTTHWRLAPIRDVLSRKVLWIEGILIDPPTRIDVSNGLCKLRVAIQEFSGKKLRLGQRLTCVVIGGDPKLYALESGVTLRMQVKPRGPTVYFNEGQTLSALALIRDPKFPAQLLQVRVSTSRVNSSCWTDWGQARLQPLLQELSRYRCGFYMARLLGCHRNPALSVGPNWRRPRGSATQPERPVRGFHLLWTPSKAYFEAIFLFSFFGLRRTPAQTRRYLTLIAQILLRILLFIGYGRTLLDSPSGLGFFVRWGLNTLEKNKHFGGPSLSRWLKEGAVILTLNPLLIYSPITWLMFLAYLAILIWQVGQAWGTIWIPGQNRALRRVTEWILLSTWIFVLTSPVTILLYEGIAWGTLLMYWIAFPIVIALIFPLLFLGTLGIILPFSSYFFISVFSRVCFCSADVLMTSLLSLAEWAEIIWIPSHRNFILIFALWIGISGMWLVKTLGSGGGLVLVTGLWAVVGGRPCFAWLYPLPCPCIDLLDVEHGLAVLIRIGDRAMLYDTGRSWRGGSIAQKVIIPYLHHHKIALEMLVISHKDNDHSGGAQDLLDAVPGLSIKAPGRIGPTQTVCRRGATWTWASLKCSVLWPKPGPCPLDNPHSLVLHLEFPNAQLLLTGDIDAKTECTLLKKIQMGSQKPLILQIPHHGSHSASSYPFLKWVRPDLALISASKSPSSKLPSKQTLKRLSTLAIPVCSSGKEGGIKVFCCGQQLQIQSYLSSVWRPWWQRIPNKF